MVSVIIPTYNAERWIKKQLKSLRSQHYPISEIIIIDSGSKDNTISLVREEKNVRLIEIPSTSFDHGATRDLAIRETNSDFVWVLTQDAIPMNDDCLSIMMQCFEKEQVAAVYARQVAPPDMPYHEKYTRDLNYPEQSETRTKADVERLGVRAYYLSNTCAVYRKSTYLQCGGFKKNLPTNEDMLMASSMLSAGYAVRYEAKAMVWHGHNSTPKQVYQRYFDLGAFLKMHGSAVQGAKVNSEGGAFAIKIFSKLLREWHWIDAMQFVVLCFARLLGYRKGQKYYKLSNDSIYKSTQNKAYWQRMLNKTTI